MYYILQNDKIILADDNRERIENAVRYSPKFFGLEIQETERPIVPSSDLSYFQFADTPEYEQEQAQKEAERIAMLNLTAADVERAIYKAKGIDFEDIITMVQAQPLSEEGEPLIDIKALKIELKANNFYRGSEWVTTVGTMLGFTPKQLDKFFDTNDYKYLTTVTLTINATPADAVVLINGEAQESVTVPYGDTAEYSVTRDGYLTQAGTVELTENTTLDIELAEEPAEEENVNNENDYSQNEGENVNNEVEDEAE